MKDLYMRLSGIRSRNSRVTSTTTAATARQQQQQQQRKMQVLISEPRQSNLLLGGTGERNASGDRCAYFPLLLLLQPPEKLGIKLEPKNGYAVVVAVGRNGRTKRKWGQVRLFSVAAVTATTRKIRARKCYAHAARDIEISKHQIPRHVRLSCSLRCGVARVNWGES